MTMDALLKKISQWRYTNKTPTSHDRYDKLLLFFPRKKINDTFNVGFENYTINSIAEMIKKS